MTKLRAHFDGKVLIPIEAVDLQPGNLYEIDVRGFGSTVAHSPREIVQMLDALPRLPLDDIEAMEQAIDSASLPASYERIFGDGDEG